MRTYKPSATPQRRLWRNSTARLRSERRLTAAFPFDGTFINPSDFPHVISSRFNAPRNYDFAPHRKQLHEGSDFAPTSAATAPYRVVAPAAGTVVKVGYDGRGYGNYLIIDHGDGWRSWLAHLEAPALVKSGSVRQGVLVGYAGTTGGSTGVHLHWTLQHIGYGLDNYVVADVIDPLPLLKP